MEIEWVANEIVDDIYKGSRKSGASKTMRLMFESLKQNPGVWAKFPIEVNSNASVDRWKRMYKGLECKVTGGNQRPIGAPDKKLWTVYVRYVNND